MKQAPLWLPYRVRNWMDQRRILAAAKGVDHTAPYHAAKPDQADVSLNMLLCKRDLKLGVLAFKSLLRFDEIKYSVTVLNDGSINQRDQQWFNQHIIGTQWQTWKMDEPAIAQTLEQYPKLADLYFRSTYEQIAKMVHPIVLSRCPRVIQFDSDTAFFKRPDRLIEWAKGNDPHPWYLHDHQDENTAVSAEAREGFADLEKTLLAPGQQWGLQHRFFNAGLLAYYPEQLDLKVADRYLEWRETAPPRFKTGKAGVWFGDWTPEQTCYHVMFALADPPPKPLGDDYHLGGEPGHVFNHFLRHYIIRSDTLNLLRKLIDELPR